MNEIVENKLKRAGYQLCSTDELNEYVSRVLGGCGQNVTLAFMRDIQQVKSSFGLEFAKHIIPREKK